MPELLRGFTVAVGLNENEEGVARLGETLTPVIDIWNDRPEWGVLRGETPCARRHQIVAGAGGTSASIGLRNHVLSGIVAVVTGIRVGAGVYSVNFYPDATVAAWTIGPRGATRDRRRTAIAQLFTHAQNTSAGVPAGGDEIEVLTGPAIALCVPIMLYAGMSIAVANNTLAAAADASFIWYERKCVLNEARGG